VYCDVFLLYFECFLFYAEFVEKSSSVMVLMLYLWIRGDCNVQIECPVYDMRRATAQFVHNTFAEICLMLFVLD